MLTFIRDLIAYKITEMNPLRLDEIVSGTGELSQSRLQTCVNNFTQVIFVGPYSLIRGSRVTYGEYLVIRLLMTCKYIAPILPITPPPGQVLDHAVPARC
jgi:hypothetical protein